jgi:hypothetical protein
MVSNLVSNAGYPPASATPPPRDTVYVPDPRLDYEGRQANALDAF